MQTVAIVGVGLIGGSFAKAIRAAGFHGRILGVSSPGVIREAVERGVIDAGASLEEAIPQADLVYLAQPIRRILDTIGRLAPLVKAGALVTDAGSTKTVIAQEARAKLGKGLFLGGHPMAGKESRGVEFSDSDLFRGRTYLICPQREDDMQTPVVQEFVRLLEGIGALVYAVPAERHDQLVAFTSHLPQLASTALAALLEGRLSDEDLLAGGPGLFDMTRLALSSFEIWTDILDTNPEAVDEALTLYIGQLERLRADLRAKAAEPMFREGASLRARLQPQRCQVPPKNL